MKCFSSPSDNYELSHMFPDVFANGFLLLYSAQTAGMIFKFSGKSNGTLFKNKI